MDTTYVSANVHANSDSVIEMRRNGATSWLAVGSVNIFVDAATLARIHAATAPAVALPTWVAERVPAAVAS